jgi:hypothetical protein
MLPGLAQLEITPEILRLLLEDLTEEEANWKPAPDRWSIAEVIEHLSHVEGHGFRSRMDQMTESTLPEILEYDQEALAAEGQYSGRDVEDSFDHWEDQREANIEFLRGLDESVVSRQGKHERLGIITIGDLLNEWAFHDMGHIRQILELLRSYRHYPKMGSFKSVYHPAP